MALPKQIPTRYRWGAYLQWVYVGVPYFVFWALTFFPMGILVALTARPQSRHPLMKPTKGNHKQRYIDEGSSGFWEYWNSSWPIVSYFNNYEDGTLGEMSGKNSARCGGRERTFWNQYKWICRNPFNWGKRTSPFFACFVNDCKLEWWGDSNISDKTPPIPGWYFCRAIHKTTGRVYYGYRSVAINDDGTIRQVNLGYKLKPSHAAGNQDADDLDKAFTLRVQFASEAN